VAKLEKKSAQITPVNMVFKIINHFPYNFKLLQVKMVLSPNTTPVYLYKELNSTGLRKMMYYLKHNTGLTPFCSSGPDMLAAVHQHFRMACRLHFQCHIPEQ
jgi:hypothetical protein